MYATAILALALVGQVPKDPVGGYWLYEPDVGERAIIHHYSRLDGSVPPEVEGWTDAVALARFHQIGQSTERQKARDKVKGDMKALEALNEKVREELQAEPRKRGLIQSLPDMTPVRVIALGSFMKPIIFPKVKGMSDVDPSFKRPLLDYALVEVTSGPSKGKSLWMPVFAVRVPTSTPPKPLFPRPGRIDTEKFDPEPESPRNPKLLLEDTSWEKPLGTLSRVHCQVKNLTGETIKDVQAKVIYKDDNGKMVSVSTILIGDLRAGESKTESSFDQLNARATSYDFEFQAEVERFKMGTIEFMRPDDAQPARKKAKRR